MFRPARVNCVQIVCRSFLVRNSLSRAGCPCLSAPNGEL